MKNALRIIGTGMVVCAFFTWTEANPIQGVFHPMSAFMQQPPVKLSVTDLGVPFRGGGLGAPLVTRDAVSGRLVLNYAGSGEFVRADFATGELLGAWHLGSGMGEFCPVKAPDGRIYLALWNGEVKRFDPERGGVEDLGEPLPGDIIYTAIWNPADNCLYGGTVGCNPQAGDSGKLWRYDPETDRFDVVCTPYEGERVFSLAALPDGRIACGVAPRARLVVVDPRTGEITDPWPDTLAPQQWLYDMAIGADGLLYTTYSPGPDIQVFDARTLEYVGNIAAPPDTHDQWRISYLDSFAGRVFGVLRPEGQLMEIDWEKGIRRRAEIGSQKMYDFTHTPDGHFVFLDTHEAVYRIADPATGQVEIRQVAYEGKGEKPLMGVWRGPDDLLYMAAGHEQMLVRGTGNADEFEKLGQVADSGGQPMYMLAHDGKLWVFSYPYAWMSVYDPQAPWQGGRAPGSNPWQCLSLDNQQNRFHQACIGPDGLIYTTTTSVYGVRGGALSRIHPDTLEVQVIRIEEQNPWAVTADDRFVYCGTAMRDESDLPPLAEEAAILVWDTEQSAFTREIRPVSGAAHYQFLYLGGNGGRILFGATAAGTLFGYNLDSSTVDYLDDTLDRDGSRIGALLKGPGSSFYVASRGRILQWDYEQGGLRELISTDHTWIQSLLPDKDGSLLATAAGRLLRFTVE